MSKRKSKAQRQAWWASLTESEQSEHIERWQKRKATRPNAAALEASARLDIATERGVFMRDIPDEDVAAKLRDNTERITR